MAKLPTIVYLDNSIKLTDDKVKVFRTIHPEGKVIWVTDYDLTRGVVEVEPMIGESIDSFINTIVGCFYEYSNFGIEICKAFDTRYLPNAVHFVFNSAEVFVTYENADPERIYRIWKEERKKIEKKEEEEYQAFMQTPEFKKAQKQAIKKRMRAQKIQVDMIILDRKTSLDFKDDQAKAIWHYWRDKQKSGYSRACVKYAQRWAKYMQYLLDRYGGITVSKIAEGTSYLADMEGITGAQHVAAVAILSKVWKYGDELLEWHNNQYNYKGDGDSIAITPVTDRKL